MTNGDNLRKMADQQGIAPRTLDDVKAGLAEAKKYDQDREMALLMTRHGRLTDEAREYVVRYLEG